MDVGEGINMETLSQTVELLSNQCFEKSALNVRNRPIVGSKMISTGCSTRFVFI